MHLCFEKMNRECSPDQHKQPLEFHLDHGWQICALAPPEFVQQLVQARSNLPFMTFDKLHQRINHDGQLGGGVVDEPTKTGADQLQFARPKYKRTQSTEEKPQKKKKKENVQQRFSFLQKMVQIDDSIAFCRPISAAQKRDDSRNIRHSLKFEKRPFYWLTMCTQKQSTKVLLKTNGDKSVQMSSSSFDESRKLRQCPIGSRFLRR